MADERRHTKDVIVLKMEVKTSRGDKMWANEISLLKNLIAYDVR